VRLKAPSGVFVVADLLVQPETNVNSLETSARARLDIVLPTTVMCGLEDSIRNAVAAISETAPVDLLIIATGVLHDVSIQPEKSIGDIDQEALLDVLRVNTVGPALVAKHFLPKMRRDAKSVFAALSARVGSIADNRLGGWVSYRTSKAALNMLLKTAAIEQVRRMPLGRKGYRVLICN